MWLQVALDNDQPEAAFDIFRKSGFKIEALNVLVEKVNDMDRAHEYAPSTPHAWKPCIDYLTQISL